MLGGQTHVALDQVDDDRIVGVYAVRVTDAALDVLRGVTAARDTPWRLRFSEPVPMAIARLSGGERRAIARRFVHGAEQVLPSR